MTEQRMNKVIDALKKELSTLRTGRANPQILDNIMVDYYGVPTPITQLGNITSPEPRLLVIAPWDPKIIKDMEKAIQKSDLGINPSNDGKVIRLLIPELTEERRKELVKIARKMGEEAKVAVRNIRRESIDQLKKQKKDGDISEDEEKRQQDDIQKLTDNKINEIDSIIEQKEKDIMTV
ncbi:ribosome recycling factor [Mahella sp.]|uniref:ribosome recycling factor n=1 Tax=Mahella sp. TaxID=2798721 RepID=UPI0025BDF08D|nr:ribosome recycling factor [Mahella sp.]